MKPIKAKINSTGEVVKVRPYQTEKCDFVVCRNGGIMGEVYMRSEQTIIGDNELYFVSLVKRMREAQEIANRAMVEVADYSEALIYVNKANELEKEVDEYLKMMEGLK